MQLLDTDHEPTGKALYAEIKQRIETGALKPGDRLVSLKELQEQFEISYRATLRAVGQLEAEGYVVSRRGSGTYVAEREARPAKPGSTAKVHVILTAPNEYVVAFIQPLLDSIQESLGQSACDKVFTRSSYEETLAILRAHESDAYVWVYPSYKLWHPIPEGPLVLVAQDMEVVSPVDTGYDIVCADSRQGGAAAGQYLREIGCKRPVILGASLDWETEVIRKPSLYTRLRAAGFRFGWGYDVPEPPMLVAAGYTPMAGAAMVTDFLAMTPRPDGVFCTSDDLADGFCHALVAHGVMPGRDVSVVGFDGQPNPFPQDPSLTTVVVPQEAMGRTAVRMALERAKDPRGLSRRINLACTLRRGQTA